MKAAIILVFCGIFAAAQAGVKISAFNIQVLGETKMSKPEVVDILVNIISRYDMIVIQEIRNSGQTVIPQLLKAVNDQNANDPYDTVLGVRVGRTSSMEQYCFMYKISEMIPVHTYTWYDADDVFEREPFNVLFDITSVGRIAFSALHAKPDDAVNELNAMENVLWSMKGHFKDIDGCVLLGDFNADCSYVSSSQLANLKLRTASYHWLIGDDVDTTVSTTDCAYDRFVVDDSAYALINAGTATIFDYETAYGLSYEQAKDVSDHWPIEFEFIN